MNELIERLAREAGLHDYPLLPPKAAVARFAALVAEQCFLTIVQGSEALGRDDELVVRRRAELIRSKFPMPKP